MAISSAQVSVTTSATLLSSTDTDGISGSSLSLVNQGSQTVYLGASGVTTATGFPLAAGASWSADLAPGEALYGIVAATTATVGVIRTGV